MSAATTFRPLGPGDAEARRDLRLEALRDFPSSFGSSYEVEAGYPLERFAQVPDLDKGMILGAFVDGALVGMGGVFSNGAPVRSLWAGIGYMYTRPAFWGSGISNTILKGLVDFADVRYKYLELSVTAGNARAERLYARYGFREFGRRPESIVVAGRSYDEILMMRFRGAG